MDNLLGDIERQILAACTVSQNARNVAFEVLQPKYFYSSKNEKVFLAIQSIETKEKPVTVVSLQEELKRCGWLDEVGWAYIADIFRDGFTGEGVEYNCQLLKDYTEKRQYEQLLLTSLSEVRNPMKDWRDVMSNMDVNAMRLGETAVVADPLADYTEVYEDVLLGRVRPYVSGFTDLDALSGGWDRG